MKKRLFSILAMFFMSITLVLTGCSSKGLTDNPKTTEQVVSNGGMSVVKGDYLYYVNGYVDVDTLNTKSDNIYGKVNHTGIYRTKLNQGREILKDDEGFLKNTELVVSKVVGFNNGGFYIIDDYIYYATPNMNLSSDGKPQTKRVEFHRINIDGTNDELIYSTPKEEESLDWTCYKVGNTVYILNFCDSKIVSVNTSSKEVVAQIEKSTSYVLFDEINYSTNNTRNNEILKYVYFTKDKENSSNTKGNIVCKFDITNGNVTEISTDSNYIYQFKFVNKNYIYYTKSNANFNGKPLLYKCSISNGIDFSNEVKMSNYDYKNYFICDFGYDLFIGNTDDKTYIVQKSGDGNIESTKIFDKAVTILGIYGGYAYYNEEGILRRFKVVDAEIVDGIVKTSFACDDTYKIILTNSNFIDFDNQRIYLYTEYTAKDESKHHYLNYVEYVNDDLNQRFVGKFEDKHLPKAPEEKKDESGNIINIPHVN